MRGLSGALSSGQWVHSPHSRPSWFPLEEQDTEHEDAWEPLNSQLFGASCLLPTAVTHLGVGGSTLTMSRPGHIPHLAPWPTSPSPAYRGVLRF